MDKKRLYWIDGLKGFACIMIFVHHFMLAFFPASYYGCNANSHITNGLDTYMSQQTISVFFNGNFWVCVFCILSGLVQAYKIYQSESLVNISDDMIKRYFKLALPVFVVSCIVYIMMHFNLFCNTNISKIVNSSWLDSFYLQKLSLKDLLTSSFITVWFCGNSDFSNAFWMLQYIFYGSYLTYLITIVSWKKSKKIKIIFYILFVAFMIINSYMVAFVLGSFLAYDIVYMSSKKNRPIWGWTLILIGLFCGGYPTAVIPTNIYHHLYRVASNYFVWHILGAYFFIRGLVYCNVVKKIFECKLFLFWGRISFAVYLVHIPIIFSLTSYVFKMCYIQTSRYIVSSMIACLISTCSIVVSAYIFNMFVEKRCSVLTHKIVKFITMDN